jgi:hypothetical protein
MTGHRAADGEILQKTCCTMGSNQQQPSGQPKEPCGNNCGGKRPLLGGFTLQGEWD